MQTLTITSDYFDEISRLTVEQKALLLDCLMSGETKTNDTIVSMLSRLILGQNERFKAARQRKNGRNNSKYRQWRKDVLERDSYTCQICGAFGGDLIVHHILRYRNNIEGRTDINNGLTLCETCHKELHKREGR